MQIHVPQPYGVLIATAFFVLLFIIMLVGSRLTAALGSYFVYAGVWDVLAGRFGAKEPPRGRVYHGTSLWIRNSAGTSSARGAAGGHVVIVSDEGIYFELGGLARLRYRPFLIPWSALKYARVAGHGVDEGTLDVDVGSGTWSFSLSPDVIIDIVRRLRATGKLVG